MSEQNKTTALGQAEAMIILLFFLLGFAGSYMVYKYHMTKLEILKLERLENLTCKKKGKAVAKEIRKHLTEIE